MKFIFSTMLILQFTTNVMASTPVEPQAKVTQDSFNFLVDRLKLTFSPLLESEGEFLDIKFNWNSSEISAYSSHESSAIYTIVINGGALRTISMNNDGAAFLLCHELGHILGGEPKYLPNFWGAAEGQADYFAANVCLKKIFASDDNIAIVKRMGIDSIIRKNCNDTYFLDTESALCQRITMAGFVFADDYRLYKKIKTKLSFEKKDSTVVKELNRSYSSPQCRLDTVVAGALCTKGFNFPLEARKTDLEFNCILGDSKISQRPSCWFLSI